MVTSKGSRAGAGSTARASLSEEDIHGIIVTEAVKAIMKITPEFFRLVNTAMIELFDDRCVVLSKVVVTTATATVATIGARGERVS